MVTSEDRFYKELIERIWGVEFYEIFDPKPTCVYSKLALSELDELLCLSPEDYARYFIQGYKNVRI